jgi:hypothetical protein
MEACELEYTPGTARRREYRIKPLATCSGSLLRTGPRAVVSAKNDPRGLTRLVRSVRLGSEKLSNLSLAQLALTLA